MNLIHVIILAIIEGITEFLPVSSTGHMIIASSVMGIAADSFVKLFTIAIQLGAILSVVFLYWRRFLQSVNFYLKLFIAFIPAAVFGVLFSKKIDALLESALTVGITLFVGGIILLFVDKWFNKPMIKEEKEISNLTAFKIGFFQCLAMIPGTSRSAATIVGGMAQKLNRTAAAEFSFFLAVPTMFAATAKKLYDFHKEGHVFTGEEIKLLAIGNIIAFIVAMLAIKTFITFLERRGFQIFGWYRIVVGAVIIGLILSGHQLQTI
ncbi:undecaprenyl-diphosphate phosphatase [Mucilaginibacter rubeus]|uniref:Undecaprenyl-diphosphatase n=1 Tax=Mucilaginibacter rubeus TaxID=2027860 RepID=A0AAE6ML51_9SPHI|nr:MULTISPECIES: undecaprenyl-diphosphate phosphatase [Mucilaginibacter]QEM07503.1 undecaprenyl-diphosphate phosphatase [Mucilaginibacter rubeus]QEM19957.1 undecaprenyl-diphosphate phosphatase [Mucilaginibacter gossypii]QTE43335.1 undecaprenyl-diphosphate phosphatase [Mucilaginibacter rubeus]QTE49935.1 undecaprenyl-diphosphate phosphatase [Mucilaginibacter rubeus]QTE55026.1 undecaprenyl-diphosphate phosphatase [Mucilaginibacter rubeus]